MSQFETHLEELIRAGKIAEVASALAKINFAQVPRARRAPLAKICRRAGLITQGLRLLQPLVRSPHAEATAASESEICEYAVLLSRNGSIAEAIHWLEQLDSKSLPDRDLYLGFCHVSDWDYEAAVLNFEDFLNREVPAYERLIAQVNLAAALVYLGDDRRARDLILQVMSESTSARRLRGNCFELLAQIYIHQKDFASAREALNQGLEIFGAHSSYDRLLLEKWAAYIRAQEGASVTPLLEFRLEAQKHAHWASVRETDFLFLKIQFSKEIFDHLYFGSPQSGYRRRLIRELKASPSPFFDWGNGEAMIDLSSGLAQNLRGFKPDSQTHRMCAALAHDLYEPFNTGRLFSALHPKDYFDVNSSPTRVRQAIRRARAEFLNHGMPLRILKLKGGYRLTLNDGVCLRLSAESDSSARRQNLLALFRYGKALTKKQALDGLKISRSTFHRLINDAIEAGDVERQGVGKKSRYFRKKRAA